MLDWVNVVHQVYQQMDTIQVKPDFVVALQLRKPKTFFFNKLVLTQSYPDIAHFPEHTTSAVLPLQNCTSRREPVFLLLDPQMKPLPFPHHIPIPIRATRALDTHAVTSSHKHEYLYDIAPACSLNALHTPSKPT